MPAAAHHRRPVAPKGQRYCSWHKECHPEGEFSQFGKYCRAAWKEYYRKRPAAEPKCTKPQPLATENFTVEATEREADMLAHGALVVRQCPRPFHALDVITSGWAANRRDDE